VHNDCLPALRGWSSQRYQFGNQQFLLDKADLTHVLQRHHPRFWNGTTRQTQTFFDPSMSIDDVQAAMTTVLQQNRSILIARGTNSAYQLRGSYNGVDYVLGINRGHISQFYPLP
jgi:hypothetical protein